MGVTFVTALFLPSGPMFKNVDTYFTLFEKLAETGIPIILYLDARLYERGNDLCQRFLNIEHCEYRTLDTSWVPKHVLLPRNRRIEKDTIDYFCIQLSKLQLLTDASAFVKTSHLAWIDFGIYHIFKNQDMISNCLKRIARSRFPTNTIFAPGCWPLQESYDVWHSICWRFCGGFLVGTPSLFAAAAQRQQSLIIGNMPGLTWEVNYWAMMESSFTNYPGDHNDLMIINICKFIEDEDDKKIEHMLV